MPWRPIIDDFAACSRLAEAVAGICVRLIFTCSAQFCRSSHHGRSCGIDALPHCCSVPQTGCILGLNAVGSEPSWSSRNCLLSAYTHDGLDVSFGRSSGIPPRLGGKGTSATNMAFSAESWNTKSDASIVAKSTAAITYTSDVLLTLRGYDFRARLMVAIPKVIAMTVTQIQSISVFRARKRMPSR